MQRDEQTIERVAKDVRVALPPGSLAELPDDVLDALIAALLSPPGKQALKLMIDDLAHGSRLTVQRWWPERLEQHRQQLGPELAEQVGAAMRPVLERLVGEHKGEPSDGSGATSTGALGIAAGLLKDLGKDFNIPVQALEALDDIKGLSASDLGARFGNTPTDGVIAGVLGLAISATLNARDYRNGRVRWDDAIDNVVFDTVKAGVTGVIVSAVAGSLALAPPLAIAVVIVLSPVIYGVVSAVVDHVYLRLLGGEKIIAARAAHLAYLQVADVIQRDLVPRLRQLNQTGALVDALHRISLDDEARSGLRENVRGTIAKLRSGASHSAELARRGRDYEDYALTLVGSRIGRQLLAVGGAQPLVRIAEIEHLSREVHQEYWREFAIASGFKRISPRVVAECVLARQGVHGQGGEHGGALKLLVEQLAEYETFRASPDEPVLVETRWEGLGSGTKKVEKYAVFASDILDLASTLLAMEKEKWPWHTELQTGLRLVPESLKLIKTSSGASPFGTHPDYHPREDKVFNKHYVNGLAEKLASGRMRLFRYKNERLSQSYSLYIAAEASDESAAEQCASIRTSLKRFHPSFRADNVLLSSLAPVEDVQRCILEPSHDLSMLTLQGARVFVVEKYTATYRVASGDPDRLGDVLYVPIEGYFRSLGEAKAGFRSISDQMDVVGVRPGPLVLPEALREQLKNVTGNDLFLLQNQLLGRLAEGLVTLDQLSNLTEARIAKLAGTGVFLSWWWSLSGRMRSELVEALSDERVRQALRIELMEALLEVQRVHILSHDFFRETIFASHAQHQETLARDAEKDVSRRLAHATGA